MNTIPFKQTDRKYPIVLIGEILIDKIRSPYTDEVSIHYGGSPANIALNLVDLGIDQVLFAGCVGNDVFGDELLNNFRRSNLSTSLICTVSGATSIVEINQTGGSPVPQFHRDADCKIPMSQELREKIKKSKLLHFSYWPISRQPARSTILEAIEIAKEHDVIVGFDPNYHPALDCEEGLSTGDLLDIMRRVDIIKPSYDDAKRIFGGNKSPEEYLQMFSDLGIRLIIMTLGKDGLICRHDDQIIQLPSLATEVVDATGAGDAFLSGLYSAIINGENLEQILHIGLLCSAYNLKYIGGRSGLPNYKELSTKI